MFLGESKKCLRKESNEPVSFLFVSSKLKLNLKQHKKERELFIWESSFSFYFTLKIFTSRGNTVYYTELF